MRGFPVGTRRLAGGVIQTRRAAVQVDDCIDCGEPIARCQCVDDVPSDVVAQMSVPSMLETLRGGR